MIDRTAGGQAAIDDSRYVQRAPELVAEIASSTVSIDLHDKLREYLRNGVTEYIAWRVLERAIDWFVLRHGEYLQLAPGRDGLSVAKSFPAYG